MAGGFLFQRQSYVVQISRLLTIYSFDSLFRRPLWRRSVGDHLPPPEDGVIPSLPPEVAAAAVIFIQNTTNPNSPNTTIQAQPPLPAVNEGVFGGRTILNNSQIQPQVASSVIISPTSPTTQAPSSKNTQAPKPATQAPPPTLAVLATLTRLVPTFCAAFHVAN
ncbi:hypothetical protein LIER_30422 [Lithospermum erythrorhizon]|uniref:Uncharacterized protein n=1 Tax=Lithospermum erythrorhizon TaxID=34254 RepID=A0AAV3RN37_LITER